MTTSPFKPRDFNSHPAFIHPAYKSTVLRGQTRPLVSIKPSLSELTGPVFGHDALGELDHDLTRNSIVDGPPLGERIVIGGRVVDEDGRPQPDMLLEIWQANASGRYVHSADQHDAPLDKNFLGSGRCVTDANGAYQFYTIKPAAYPWPNHANAWRPGHIHFSLFGASIATRLVTQMYFPGDPLLDLDPIYLSSPAGYRELMVADFELDRTQEGFALGYTFDLVLRGRQATPMEA